MTGQNEVKSKYITLRVTLSTRTKLREMANRDQRTLTGLLSKLINDAIAADEAARQ